jgi:hypothetical protein
MKNIIYILILIFSVIFILTGCFNPMVTPGNSGNVNSGGSDSPVVQISIDLPAALSNGAKGYSVNSVTVTAKRTDDLSIEHSIDITVAPGAVTAVGSFSGLTVHEWLFEGEAMDSEGNIIYSGSRTYTVLDGEDNYISFYLFANVGDLWVTAGWTGAGAVDTLRITASKDTFDDVTVETPAPVESESGTVFVLNLVEGTDWQLHVEGLNQGVSCFEEILTSIEVVAADTLNVASTLSQIKVTPVVFSKPPGLYLSSFDLDLTTATPGALIYYTIDGDAPNPPTTGTLYDNVPFTISGTTVRAIATKVGVANASEVTEVVYSVDSVVSISSSYNHNAMVKEDNTLWMWGDGTSGRLGTGSTDQENLPVQVGGVEWSKASAGFQHTAAIKTDGTLWTWGYNYYGALGQANNTDANVPTLIFEIPIDPWGIWIDVSAGDNFTLAIQAVR